MSESKPEVTTLPTPHRSDVSGSGYNRRSDYDRRRDLPRVDIPIFQGNILEWPHFWKLFDKQVHSVAEFDDDDKLIYLRKYFQSPNDVVIIDDASSGPGQYAGYIKILKKKYDKPRVIHKCHTKEILSIPPMKDASARKIARLQAAVTNGIIKLKTTGQYEIDAVITSMTESLLVGELQEAWNKETREDRLVPKIEKLLDFLADAADARGALLPENTREPTKAKQEREDKPKPKYERKYESPYKKGKGNSQQPTTSHREVYTATSSWPLCKLCK